MRDGQTVQYTVATDAVTGQVVKLDVTVNVLK
jgi:predicted small secreted protein